ncbi:NTP transferase domain-containing protein [Candidatus Micrarchaeota archaeon]|nr:NTP transferase domain-containing protein [Candidatus Micrarchaeota archaeon]
MEKVLFILCGGKGTRLGAITKKVPKPLIKLKGRAFILHLIKIYSPLFDRIVLLAGYKGKEFIKLKINKVDLKIEEKQLGTGGALIRIFEELPEQFFICNGDTFLWPLDLNEFIEFCENGKRTTLMLCEDEGKARGSVSITGNSVSEFKEKSGSENGLVYTGFCSIMKKDIIKWRARSKLSMEKEVFPTLAKECKLACYVGSSKIYDIGTHKGMQRFKELLNI